MSASLCQSYFSLFIDIDGIVWSFGENQYGQLGVEDIENRSDSPEKIHFLPLIHLVACGHYHSLFLDFEGFVWSCGLNEYGQLGLGDYELRTIPQKIQTVTEIQKIACGRDHSILLDSAGQLWAFGHNGYGELGVGDRAHKLQPTLIERIPPSTTIQAIFCGGDTSMFIDLEGSVWCCGNNEFGQLGLGDNIHRSVPEKVSHLDRIQAVSCGRDHSIFLNLDGEVFACGFNKFGQLGLGDTENRNIPALISSIPIIESIACGDFHTLLVDEHGAVWGFGINEIFQLGFLSNTQIVVLPIKVENLPKIHTIACGEFLSNFVD